MLTPVYWQRKEFKEKHTRHVNKNNKLGEKQFTFQWNFRNILILNNVVNSRQISLETECFGKRWNFSRAWRRLRFFPLTSDWFSAFFTLAVIGPNYHLVWLFWDWKTLILEELIKVLFLLFQIVLLLLIMIIIIITIITITIIIIITNCFYIEVVQS